MSRCRRISGPFHVSIKRRVTVIRRRTCSTGIDPAQHLNGEIRRTLSDLDDTLGSIRRSRCSARADSPLHAREKSCPRSDRGADLLDRLDSASVDEIPIGIGERPRRFVRTNADEMSRGRVAKKVGIAAAHANREAGGAGKIATGTRDVPLDPDADFVPSGAERNRTSELRVAQNNSFIDNR